MLTGMVNIAVFAAFRFAIGIIPYTNAEFKRIRGSRQLDFARSERQKRHDLATSGKGDGTIGKVWAEIGRFHGTALTAAIGRDCHACLSISMFRRTRRRVAHANRTKIP